MALAGAWIVWTFDATPDHAEDLSVDVLSVCVAVMWCVVSRSHSEAPQKRMSQGEFFQLLFDLRSAILADISDVARRELVLQETSEKRVIFKRACLGPRQRIPSRCR